MKIYDRWLEGELTGKTSKNKIKLLFGARQTGKSTIIKKIAPADALFINLQERTERLLFERNKDELIKRLGAIKVPKTVIIDEIQKVPSLLEDIQLVYDRNSGDFNFILSGSSARKLHTAALNLLPGRSHQFRLFPVILAEMEKRQNFEILPLPWKINLKTRFRHPHIEELLIYGALPGILLENPESKVKTLETYSELYLEEEIRREALVRNVGHFSSFLELSAVESGNIMNLTNLSHQTGIPISTLKIYYQILVDTFVGFWIFPFIHNLRKRVSKTPKFYFFDTGVRNALSRIPMQKNILKIQAGQLFEQWVVSELYNRCLYLGKEYRLYYWKTVTGVEVDAILSTPEGIIPIEIKWTQSPAKSDIKSLEIFLTTFGRIAQKGYLICRCPHKLQLSEKITAVPWEMI
ncbi:MAG: DUF4143 domain-containing protein [Elusimicrobiota bacterium]